ncbi:MAG: DNA polymerase IV [Sulfuriflexus sp.]|nr:DNA polymerase IV [Sulfuriflexus sp.]
MIIHLDMDAFFASVEMRERPELADLPVVVGGSAAGRGVVAAASYEARKFGVFSAMPMAKALKQCPKLICLPVNMPLYIEVSQQIHEIFYRYTPEIEPLSLDEAFLDVTASEKLFGSAAEVAKKIKTDIKNECQLIASAGIAPNKFVAKIASDIDKPNGFVIVEQNEVQDFLDPLPIKRIWGVGKKTEQQLHEYGINTVYELRNKTSDWLIQRFGKLGDHIFRLANGQDKREVVSDAKAKSISSETTFATDIRDKEVLLAILSQLSEQVASRLRVKDVKGKTISIKIRFHDFKTITRSKTLFENSSQTMLIWQVVKQLFLDTWQEGKMSIRLVGVSVSGFSKSESLQSELFEQDTKQDTLDVLSDKINQRFGKAKIHRGRKNNG